MNKLLFASLLALTFASPVLAQQKADDHAAHHIAASAPAAAEMTEGEIRKVDKTAGTMTIKHGEIKNLGMPPMTMVFKAKSVALLDKVKVGDKVRFTAEQSKAGALIVTDVQPAAPKP
jgi:Cu(I)/Ag(I) efflux system protein CusF